MDRFWYWIILTPVTATYHFIAVHKRITGDRGIVESKQEFKSRTCTPGHLYVSGKNTECVYSLDKISATLCITEIMQTKNRRTTHCYCESCTGGSCTENDQ